MMNRRLIGGIAGLATALALALPGVAPGSVVSRRCLPQNGIVQRLLRDQLLEGQVDRFVVLQLVANAHRIGQRAEHLLELDDRARRCCVDACLHGCGGVICGAAKGEQGAAYLRSWGD